MRKLLKSITNKFKASKIEILLKNRNLQIGENCLVSNLNIECHNFEIGFNNVYVGEDCNLNCNIFLLHPNAKVTIGDRVFIGTNTMLFVYEEVIIENDTMFSWGCTVIDNNSHSLLSEGRKTDVLDWNKGQQFKNWDNVIKKPVKICEKSWIGFNSIISKGVTIGEGSIVASGSVVTKSTEPYSIVGGNPAIFIKKTT